MRRSLAPVLPSLGIVLGLASPALAQEATSAGTPSAAHPTFHNIGISWPIAGDDDADGVVAVRYRREGDAAFRDAMPLFRVPAGSTDEGFTWINRHAGSIFGLEPATTYEIELELTDPDGGDVTELLTVTTRTWPEVVVGAREIPVDPDTLDDALDAAQPGDVLLLADGTYGETYVDRDGTAAMPIVIRAANPQGAVFEGNLVMNDRSYLHVEGLLVRGTIRFDGAVGIVVRNNRVETDGDGILSHQPGVQDALVVDNVVVGPSVWAESSLGVDGNNVGEGIKLTGPGNVMAFNRVTGFRDCISLVELTTVEQYSIDIYGNDLSVCPDDGIEADFAMGNVRVYQNRIADSFMGISSQPSLGGPTYFIRNVQYNTAHQAFKLQRTSVGDVLWHNTSVKSGDAFAVNTSTPIRRATSRNNLFLGGPGVDNNGYFSGSGEVIRLATATPDCDLDHDGFGAIGVGSFTGRIGQISFDSLEEMRANTTEAHAIEVDLSIFEEDVAYPADPFGGFEAPSLALAAGSTPIDAGLPLPNVNDGFEGDAPDLGAYERGHELPVYGPGGKLGSGSSAGAGGGGGSGSGGAGSGAGGPGAGGNDPGGPAGAGGGDASSGPGGLSGAGTLVPGIGNGDADDGGCGCRLAGAPGPAPAGGALALLGLGALAARSRRRGTPR